MDATTEPRKNSGSFTGSKSEAPTVSENLVNTGLSIPCLSGVRSGLDILAYARLSDTQVTITLPRGMSIFDAKALLNLEARKVGLRELFETHLRPSRLWESTESNTDFRTVPGVAYSLRLPLQTNKENKPGAVALAEACERIRTNDQGTLFGGRGYRRFLTCNGYEIVSDVMGVRFND